MRPSRAVVVCAAFMLASCGGDRARVVSGYVEGEYVHIAAPEGGWVTEVLVARGANVKAGDALFTLDAEAQMAQRDQAAAQILVAKAQLANLQKGRRPDEIAGLEASLAQAKANFALADAELTRASDLKVRGYVSQSFLDARQAQRETVRQQLKLAQSNLALARKGARDDEIAAANANVVAASAALARAEYALNQRRILAKVSGRVEDVLRRQGEFVPPGGAILQVLPPRNVKIRFFVPELLRARVKVGLFVDVNCDGCGRGHRARITFLSLIAEYTPPVIYSTGSREKLVWMVEAEPAKGVHLSPGQPVDVTLP